MGDNRLKHCEATTKRGKPCSLDGDRLVGGKWLCHVHEPGGVLRCQQAAKRIPPTGKDRQVALLDKQRHDEQDIDPFPMESPAGLEYRKIDGETWVKLPPWPVTIRRS